MTARDWLAKRAELEGAAPSAPWMYTERADGNPADGPTLTALVANHPTLGEQTIAQGDYDSWSGHALIFAADARTSAPAMRKALEAALEIHHLIEGRPDCGNGCCGVVEDECAECRYWPCYTVTAIEAALGDES